MRGVLEPRTDGQAQGPDREQRRGPEGRLLRGYLHKTSNTLCGIKGYASLIARGAGTPESSRWAEKIINEVERMEEVFRAVGDLTADAPRNEAYGVLADIVARSCEDALRRHPHLTITVEAVPEVPTLLPAADLSLVLGEFLDNSAEGRDGRPGPVHVTLTFPLLPTGRVALVCVDDGPGPLPALAPKAGEPFLTTKDGRPGIGLTRVDTLAEMYDLAWHLHPGPRGGAVAACEVAGVPVGWTGDDRQETNQS
ncbi:MAG: HAMP domain-containing histidine kinase [bacterium]|nr:HAMP domain-containing histidine kinase [bacterium]